MRRLLLIRHASTEAVRRAAFPVDEPLDDSGRRAATALAGRLGRGEELCSPALRARETATAAGLDPALEPALDECDFGSWAGRSLAEIHEQDPAGTTAWMTDPSAQPHGGESLLDLLARVGEWMSAQGACDGRAIAVTHAGVVKAAIVHALSAPPQAFWRVDVSPLGLTELTAHDGRWTVACVNARSLSRGPATSAATGAPSGDGDRP